jgi:hypothetical protein
MLALAHTSALAAGHGVGGQRELVFRRAAGSAHGRTSRAVSRNTNFGSPALFRIQADRFDYEVKFVGAVDLARYAVGHVGPDELGFGES